MSGVVALSGLKLPTVPDSQSSAEFTVRDLDLAKDVDLVHTWMNQPDIAGQWGLHGSKESIAAYIGALQSGTHVRPCIGYVDGVPMSYWEIYRADLDPLARYFPFLHYDLGLNVLIGPSEYRGRGIGPRMIAAVCDDLFEEHRRTRRIVAEIDVHAGAAHRAFQK